MRMDRSPSIQEAPPINLDLIRPGVPTGYSDERGNRVIILPDIFPDKKGGQQTVATVLIRSVNGGSPPTFSCYQGIVDRTVILSPPFGERLQIHPHPIKGNLTIKPPESMGRPTSIEGVTRLTSPKEHLPLNPGDICQVQIDKYGLRLPLNGPQNKLHPVRLKLNHRGVPTLSLPKSDNPGVLINFEISNGLPVFVSVGANGAPVVSREKPVGRESFLVVRQGTRFLIENTGVTRLEIDMNTRAAHATLPKPGRALADCQDSAFACMGKNGGGGLFVVDAMGGQQSPQDAVTVKNIVDTHLSHAVKDDVNTIGEAKAALLRAYEDSLKGIREKFGDEFRGGAVATAAIDLGKEKEIVIFHMGDTRIYGVNARGDITLLTTDHSEIPPKERAIIDNATGRNDPRLNEIGQLFWDMKHRVTRSISLAPTAGPELTTFKKGSETWGLIAITDGKESLQEERFARIVRACVTSGRDPDQCVQLIVNEIHSASIDRANLRAKKDDIGIAILLVQ